MQSTFRLLATIFLLLCAAAAEAQVHLYGRVIEHASEQPVAGATVVLHSASGRRLARQITDDLGQFSFVVRGNGPVLLRTERIGYRSTTTPPLHFDTYTLLQVEVRMDIAAVVLAPLEVVARSRSHPSPTLAGFARRRQTGVGWYMSRAEIEQQNASRLSDIVAMAPGVTLHRRIVYMARAGNCPAQIYVDGSHINRSIGQLTGRRSVSTTEMFPIDDVVKPGMVEGIEVYQGISRVPTEFLSPEAACGVVAIWTRRSG